MVVRVLCEQVTGGCVVVRVLCEQRSQVAMKGNMACDGYLSYVHFALGGRTFHAV